MNYWRYALFGVFMLMIFEGVLRKLIPSAQVEIYLLKDAILLAVYFGFLLEQRKTKIDVRSVARIKLLLVLGLIFGCLEIFNPNSPSVLVGIVGVKNYFLYAPIAFILPFAFNSQAQLAKLLKYYIAIAMPVAVLGFIQVAGGAGSALNFYVNSPEDPTLAALARFGNEDLVRTSGTFSYIAGYTIYLTFITFLATAYNLAEGWRLKTALIPLIALPLVVAAMFTTGSRAPVYMVIVAIPIILLLAVRNGTLPFGTAIRVCILAPIIGFAAVNIYPPAFSAFVERATDPGSEETWIRATSPITETIGVLSTAPVFGMGIGTTHPSSLTVVGTDWPWWLGDLLTENEPARISVELGFIGLLLTYVLRIMISVASFQLTRSFKDRWHRAFGLVLSVYLTMAMTGSIMLNATAGLYYWGSFGLILAMRRQEQSARSLTPVRVEGARVRLPQPMARASVGSASSS
jgi:hypothetical protein